MSVPVIFLHGFATSTERTWREPGWFDLVQEGGRKPIGIDLLGHGESDKPHEAAGYEGFLDHVISKMPKSMDGSLREVDVVGYSLGARTALEVAMRHPGRIRRLVLGGVGANLVGGGHRPNDGEVAHDLGTDNVGYRFQGLINDGHNDPEALTALQEWMSGTFRAFTPAQLATVTSRCLLVIGDEDFVGRPEPLAELLPDVKTIVLPGVDHFSLPKQFGFIDAALEFLDAVPRW